MIFIHVDTTLLGTGQLITGRSRRRGAESASKGSCWAPQRVSPLLGGLAGLLLLLGGLAGLLLFYQQVSGYFDYSVQRLKYAGTCKTINMTIFNFKTFKQST